MDFSLHVLALCVLRMIRIVLPRVCLLIVVEFDKSVVSARDQSTQERPNPVYPVITWEVRSGNTRTEWPGRIKRASGKVYTCDVRQRWLTVSVLFQWWSIPASSATNKASPMPTVDIFKISSSYVGNLGRIKAPKGYRMEWAAGGAPTWSDESGFALFGGQHQHGEDKFCCQKHFDEDSLGDGCSTGQSCSKRRFTGKHAPDKGRCLHIWKSAWLLRGLNTGFEIGPDA